MRTTSFLACAALSATVAACAPSVPKRGAAGAPELDMGGQTKCSVQQSQLHPLIVEWPASDRASLEAMTSRGRVAVRYSGCELEVLRRCRVPGSYAYVPLTPKRDNVSITNEDELYANIPVYAAKFEGVLAQSGQLNVDMTVVGMFESDGAEVGRGDLRGACEGASHVVDAFTVGAFAFFAGSRDEAGAGVEVAGIGAGAKHRASNASLREEGRLDACGDASRDDESPPDGCGGLLRLDMVALSDGAGSAPGSPARAAISPPPAVATAAPRAPAEPEPIAPPPPKAELAPEDHGYVDSHGGAGWGNRCFKHVKQRQLSYARAACERGLARNPSPAIRGAILFSLAIAEQLDGNDAVACEHLRESLRVRPNNAPTEEKLTALGCASD